MKLKNILMTGLSFVLVAALSIGGTLAYLQDDDSDVNVMTLGNVKIEQLEYERAKNEDGTWKTDTIDDRTSYVLQDFTQAKPLYPATEVDADGNPVNHGAGNLDSIPVRFSQVGSAGGQQPFVSENAQDKFVLIENTGKTDAYVRTLVAIECGTGDSSLIGILHFEPTWNINKLAKIVVDGVNYYVIEYVYKGVADGSRHPNGVLPAGDTTYPNLCQVYLKAIATNEDMEAIDGNGNGTLDILVLSQAVQAAGFENAQTALDTAFGKSSEKAAEWFGGEEFEIPTTVATADELTAALAEGGNVVLTDDITLASDVNVTVAEGTAASINLNGYTLEGSSATTGKNRSLFTVKGDLTVTNGTVVMTHTGDNMGWSNLVSAFSVEGGELTLDGVTINASGSDMAYGVDVNTTLGETVLNINDSDINSTYTAVRIFNNHKTATGTVNLNSGALVGNSRDIWVHNPSANAVDANGIVNIADDYTYTVTVQDTFNNSRIYQID